MKKYIYLLLVLLLASPVIFSEMQKLKYELVFEENEEDENRIFNRVMGFDVDDNDNIYIVDMLDCIVKVFDRNQKFLFSFGKKGTGPQEFFSPMYIDIKNGEILVYDYFKIKYFNMKGKYLRSEKIYTLVPPLRKLNTDLHVTNLPDEDGNNLIFGIYDKEKAVEVIDTEKIFRENITPKSRTTYVKRAYTYLVDSNKKIIYSDVYIFSINKYSNGKSIVILEPPYKPRPISKETLEKRYKALPGYRKLKHQHTNHIMVKAFMIDKHDNIIVLLQTEKDMRIDKYTKDGALIKSYLWDEELTKHSYLFTLHKDLIYFSIHDPDTGFKIYKTKLN